jgi:hypothetical protein
MALRGVRKTSPSQAHRMAGYFRALSSTLSTGIHRVGIAIVRSGDRSEAGNLPLVFRFQPKRMNP